MSANFEDAFRSLWASQAIFATVPFGDIVDHITVTSVWDGANSQWIHTVEIEYKPESPLSHVAFSTAARTLVGSALVIEYCGCTVTITITDTYSGYNMATGSTPPKSKSPKCKGAYRPPKGMAKKSTLTPIAATSSATTTTTVVAAVAVVSVVVVAAIGFAISRRRVTTTTVTDESGETDADAAGYSSSSPGYYGPSNEPHTTINPVFGL